MDQRPLYEQLIAGKLEALPVPDMADAIWARIKGQLDIDLPTDDGGGNGGNNPSGPGIIGWGLSVVLVALLTVFYFTQNKPKTESIQNTPAPQQQITLPIEQAKGPPGSTNSPPREAPSPGILQPGLPVLSADSIQPEFATSLPAIKPDSQAVVPPSTTVALTKATDTLPPTKKKKGVTGITDNDYRVIPKNDKN